MRRSMLRGHFEELQRNDMIVACPPGRCMRWNRQKHGLARARARLSTHESTA